MTHTLDPVDHWIEGDSKRFELTVTDDDGDVIVPGGTDEFSFRVQNSLDDDPSDAVLDETAAEVEISIEDSAAGRVDIFVQQDNGLSPGDYWLRIVHDPGGDTKQSWRARLSIDR